METQNVTILLGAGFILIGMLAMTIGMAAAWVRHHASVDRSPQSIQPSMSQQESEILML